MGCKPITCSVCGKTFPACQIKNGKCASCRAKEVGIPVPPRPPESKLVNK